MRRPPRLTLWGDLRLLCTGGLGVANAPAPGPVARALLCRGDCTRESSHWNVNVPWFSCGTKYYSPISVRQ